MPMSVDVATFSPEACAWLSKQLGVPAQDLLLMRMAGSTSSSLYRIAVRREPTIPHGVLRVIDNQAWLAEEADLAVHEAAVLQEAERAGFAAPRLIGYAQHDVGFGAPVVLMSFVPGRIELQPAGMDAWLEQLAAQLAAIHRHQAPQFPWRYRSWFDRRYLGVPTWTKQPHLWEKAIALYQAGEPEAEPVFLHRDYHPTNVLWQNERISGVVDWINACIGPAGVDVAHCRINLATMCGSEVAARFLALYMAQAPDFTYQPYWDVEAILNACLPELTYYTPWREFGLPDIPMEELRQRVERHLAQVL